MSHKRNFENFIDPRYKFDSRVDVSELRRTFQRFQDELMKLVPDKEGPKEPYFYNCHMGAFTRELDHAKDSFVNGLLAYYCTRNTCDDEDEKGASEFYEIENDEKKVTKML